MKSKDKLYIGLAAATVLVSSAWTIPRAFAADTSPTSGISSLIDKIATKFNLNKDEVKAVFDEEQATRHAERQAEMKTRTEERLTEAVTDGDITQAQKDLITAKLSEIQTKQTDISQITDDGDRNAAMAQLHADLAKWAADNDIDTQWIMFGGRGGGHGMGRGHGMMR